MPRLNETFLESSDECQDSPISFLCIGVRAGRGGQDVRSPFSVYLKNHRIYDICVSAFTCGCMCAILFGYLRCGIYPAKIIQRKTSRRTSERPSSVD